MLKLLIGFVVCLELLLTTQVYGQQYIATISYNIPVYIFYSHRDTRQGNGQYSSGISSSSVHDSAHTKVNKQNIVAGREDTIRMVLSNVPYLQTYFSITFEPDTQLAIIHNVSVHFHNAYNATEHHYTDDKQFNLLNVTLVSRTDSTLEMAAYGSSCRNALTFVKWNYDEAETGSPGWVVSNSTSFDSLIEDTTHLSFYFSIQRVPDLGTQAGRATASVPEMSAVYEYGTFSNTLLYPKSSEAGVLRVYDVLGRLVSETSVERSEGKTVIPRGSLPPGLYFARLGEMTTSFIVP